MFSIELAQYMKNKGFNIKFFFIGQGSMEMTIRNEIERRDLKDIVEILGLRTDITELMGGADVMIMPSLYEGFPVVLVEAQSVGLRSVISDTISQEVDLDVGLIDFLSLKSDLEKWTNMIILKKKSTFTLEQRLNKISEQGFDIVSNVQKLQALYDTIL